MVHTRQHYDGSEGRGEIDCAVGGVLPVLAEVKSHSLTDHGRRGHRPRLARVADDVVRGSFGQTRRAFAYVLEGGRAFADHEGGDFHRQLPDEVVQSVEIVVTLSGSTRWRYQRPSSPVSKNIGGFG
jgi:hypothetical protein